MISTCVRALSLPGIRGCHDAPGDDGSVQEAAAGGGSTTTGARLRAQHVRRDSEESDLQGGCPPAARSCPPIVIRMIGGASISLPGAPDTKPASRMHAKERAGGKSIHSCRKSGWPRRRHSSIAGGGGGGGRGDPTWDWGGGWPQGVRADVETPRCSTRALQPTGATRVSRPTVAITALRDRLYAPRPMSCCPAGPASAPRLP